MSFCSWDPLEKKTDSLESQTARGIFLLVTAQGLATLFKGLMNFSLWPEAAERRDRATRELNLCRVL